MRLRKDDGKTFQFGWLLLSVLAVTFQVAASEEDERPEAAARPARTGWSVSTEGGYLYQMESDIDDGGSFSLQRAYGGLGLTYSWERLRSATLALGYGFDEYTFSGDDGFGGLEPWEDVHSVRLSAPLRYAFNSQWTGFAVPVLRSSAEDASDFDEALSGGGFLGASYRFNDRLTLGPGLGYITQIEDDPSVFPVLLVNWKIAEDLSLTTGRGVAATLGPGLFLNWRARPDWNVAFGGRLDKFRFRLDDKGDAPHGVGEDWSFPLLLAVSYTRNRRFTAGLAAGVKFGGELRLEDDDGGRLAEDGYDAVPFVGVSLRFQF